jgi:hypothetical protein
MDLCFEYINSKEVNISEEDNNHIKKEEIAKVYHFPSVFYKEEILY